MIGVRHHINCDGLAIALLGFNDLGRSATPTFLFRNRYYLQLSPHYPKLNKKINVGSLKKFQDFSPRDMGFCHLAVLWSLNAYLFFEEPHQLTKFASYVHLYHIWKMTFPFKALTAVFWD